jgi:chorismate mutase
MSREDKAQERREDCRREVRAFLAQRQQLAHRVSAIKRRLNIENDFTDEEIEAALIFLAGLGEVSSSAAELGATKFFQATSAGVLAYERSN